MDQTCLPNEKKRLGGRYSNISNKLRNLNVRIWKNLSINILSIALEVNILSSKWSIHFYLLKSQLWSEFIFDK